MQEDVIYRQAAIDKFEPWLNVKGYNEGELNMLKAVLYELKCLPSSELERDIPMKPMETTDRTWGIQARQAVCPKCDYYLSNVVFIGDGKRVTYCEHCGQAIDWEGWDAECSE